MRGFLVFILLALFVVMFGIPAYLGPDDLAGCEAPQEQGRCQAVDAIVTVSGGDTSARAAEAIRLYKAGWGEYLIFSGAASDTESPSNALVMKKQAVDAGVAESAVLIDEASRDTSENAANVATIIKERAFSRVMLVSSAYHQRRVNIEFSRQLQASVQLVNHPAANDSQWSKWWWLTPYGWWLGLGELLKIFIVSLGGVV